MDWESVAPTLVEVVAPVLMAVVAWAAARLAQLIRAKVGSEYLKGVLLRLNDSVVTAVKDLQTTVVDEIKKASADGKLTTEEKRRIKATALDNLKSYLGPKGLKELGRILNLGEQPLESFLGSKIEAAVLDVKAHGRAAIAGSGVASAA